MTKRACFPLILLLLLPHLLLAMPSKSIIYQGRQASSISLPAVLSASLLQPDFIELPLMLSKDNIPVVFDDLVLQRSTNVARLFPGRSREDGNYYIVDFTLEELEQLSYLGDSGIFGQITTHPASLGDMLAAIEISTSRQNIGLEIMPVVKYPWFHANEGKDISSVVLKSLIAHAGSAEAPLYLKCFDPDELQRISKDILPGLPLDVLLVQGIETFEGRETMRRERSGWTGYNYEWFFTRLGLRVAAEYADVLWLSAPDIVPAETLERFINDSQGLKMKVFISTENVSTDDFEFLLFTLNADGLAVSEPAPLRRFLDNRETATDDGGTATGNGEESDILKDPEALIERLKKAKQVE